MHKLFTIIAIKKIVVIKEKKIDFLKRYFNLFLKFDTIYTANVRGYSQDTKFIYIITDFFEGGSVYNLTKKHSINQIEKRF